MRQELIELQDIEHYLQHRLSEEDNAVFGARLIVQSELQEKVQEQRGLYRLIRLFSRREERKRLDGIFQTLLQEPQFAQELKTIFG